MLGSYASLWQEQQSSSGKWQPEHPSQTAAALLETGVWLHVAPVDVLHCMRVHELYGTSDVRQLLDTLGQLAHQVLQRLPLLNLHLRTLLPYQALASRDGIVPSAANQLHLSRPGKYELLCWGDEETVLLHCRVARSLSELHINLCSAAGRERPAAGGVCS
jgi:hypothetical protein